MKPWIKAARLRTLPLSTGAIALAGVFCCQAGIFNLSILILAWTTAVLLQVLSNFANDYGDFKKGTDTHRKDRMVSAGAITAKAMLNAIIVLSVLTFLCGTFLVFISFGGFTTNFWLMMVIGISCIAAAIAYTVGKRPYGYMGFGDLFVFIFFGPVAVCGTLFLCRQSVEMNDLFPGAAFGLWAVMVLNINNLRDLTKDVQNNKKTLVVLMGYKNGVIYHFILLISSWILLGLGLKMFNFLPVFFIGFVGLLGMFLIFIKLRNGNMEHNEYNVLLKFQSLISLGSVLILVLIKWLTA